MMNVKKQMFAGACALLLGFTASSAYAKPQQLPSTRLSAITSSRTALTPVRSCQDIPEDTKSGFLDSLKKNAKRQEQRENAQRKVKASSGVEDEFDEDGIATIDEILAEEGNEIFDGTPSMDYEYNGSVLNRTDGVNNGPSGRETYYNLPMDGVVEIMRAMGNTDPYWVREDGVKMLGDYVMVAAHLPTRPRGSYVMTSLGMGLVCDTGTFALKDHYQLDIAVDWD